MGKRDKSLTRRTKWILFLVFFAVFFAVFSLSGAKIFSRETNDDHSVFFTKSDQRLVSVHTLVWKLIGLPPQVADELNDLVATASHLLNRLQYSPDSAKLQVDRSSEKRKSDGPKQFEASHAERFKALGLSEAAQYELSNILNTVWRIRYDPNAFTDPNWDKHYAEKLRILFGDSVPPCCSEAMYKHIGMWKNNEAT